MDRTASLGCTSSATNARFALLPAGHSLLAGLDAGLLLLEERAAREDEVAPFVARHAERQLLANELCEVLDEAVVDLRRGAEATHAGDIVLAWTDLLDPDTLTLSVPALNFDPGSFSLLEGQILVGDTALPIGTGTRAAIRGHQIAGKTGTSQDRYSVAFVGYTPELLAGVWLGFDNPRPIGSGATGGTLAVPVWAKVMRTAYANREPPEAWRRPPDVVVRRVSGGRVLSEDCPGGTPDFFAARHVPQGSCPQPAAEPRFVDPTPELPGRPVFPGQKKEPRPEDFITPGEGRR